MIEPPNGIDVSQPSNNDTSTAPVIASSSGDNFAVPQVPKKLKPKQKIDNGSQSDSSTRSSKKGRKAKNKETKKRRVEETNDSEFDTGREEGDGTEDEEMLVNEAISSEAFNRLHKRLILLEKTNADQKSKIASLDKEFKK